MSSLEDIIGTPISDAVPSFESPKNGRSQGHATTIAREVARNMARWHNHPWHMIEDGVIFTLDQADMKAPIKRFPPFPWLEVLVEEWLDNKLVVVPKSRRMLISWLFVYLHLWLALFHEGVNCFFVSDKEEKSDELVQRAYFMYNQIPNDKMLKPKARSIQCLLEFPNLHSQIKGVPQGADQLRQYTATAIFADEMAFWQRARETFMAAKPTIEGGGRFTCVSSAAPGFFKDLVFDAVY